MNNQMNKNRGMRLTYEINKIEKTESSYIYHYVLTFDNDSTKVRINFNLCIGLWDTKCSESLFSQEFNDQLYSLINNDPQDFIKKLETSYNCSFATPLFQIKVFGERIILNNCLTIIKNPDLEDDIIDFFTDLIIKMQQHSCLGQYLLNSYVNTKYNGDETSCDISSDQSKSLNKLFRNFYNSSYSNDNYKKIYEEYLVKYGDI